MKIYIKTLHLIANIFKLGREKLLTFQPGEKDLVAFPQVERGEFSSGIHSSLLLGESINSPLNSWAVKTKTYQSSPLNFGNMSRPCILMLRICSPDSSRTSRMTHSSGDSLGLNLPPNPFHLPACMSLDFLLRCSRFDKSGCDRDPVMLSFFGPLVGYGTAIKYL